MLSTYFYFATAVFLSFVGAQEPLGRIYITNGYPTDNISVLISPEVGQLMIFTDVPAMKTYEWKRDKPAIAFIQKPGMGRELLIWKVEPGQTYTIGPASTHAGP
ncbi:hypothetical protein BGW42_005321 [Actinomortierella wolfii]|nr:hypothetical protein BGW42_005321 [Actinomortierella wolfii]